jgi:ribonuclease P protein component
VTPAHATTGPGVAPRQFDKSRRLRRRAEFQHVFDTGQRVRGRFFTLIVAPSQESNTRLGIVASRKMGDAVRRNRAKRLIREMFRRNVFEYDRGQDVVVIPRIELFEAAYATLEEDFRQVLARATARLRKP